MNTRSPAGPRSLPRATGSRSAPGGSRGLGAKNMRMVISTRARTFATVALCFALGATLAFVPPSGLWWNVIRWPFYLPIFLIGSRYGPFSGLACGVAVALFFILVAASREDGRFLARYRRDRRCRRWIARWFLKSVVGFPATLLHKPDGPVGPWRSAFRSRDQHRFESACSIEIAAGLLAQEDTSTAVRGELVGIVLTECEHLSASIQGVLERFRTPARGSAGRSRYNRRSRG